MFLPHDRRVSVARFGPLAADAIHSREQVAGILKEQIELLVAATSPTSGPALDAASAFCLHSKRRWRRASEPGRWV